MDAYGKVLLHRSAFPHRSSLDYGRGNRNAITYLSALPHMPCMAPSQQTAQSTRRKQILDADTCSMVYIPMCMKAVLCACIWKVLEGALASQPQLVVRSCRGEGNPKPLHVTIIIDCASVEGFGKSCTRCFLCSDWGTESHTDGFLQ